MKQKDTDNKYVGKFLEDDYNEFKDNILNLLHDYKKKSQRLDKIIKLSDKQQLQLLKLNDELDEYKNNLELKVNEELEKNRQKDLMMMQQSRLAQMGEMISLITHQWKQPLSSINSTVLSLQLDGFSNKYDLSKEEELCKFLAQQDEKFKKITNQVKHLSDTIDDFKNFFAPNKIKSLTDISLPVKKALDIVQTDLACKNINIDVDFKTNSLVNIHLNEIVHVILNLIKNSEDVFLEREIDKPKILIETKECNENLYILFQDNGGGIDDDILPKIFDSYFSTKDKSNGTGIGLYMSKMIIKDYHNGDLEALNIEDGVKFIISFKK